MVAVDTALPVWDLLPLDDDSREAIFEELVDLAGEVRRAAQDPRTVAANRVAARVARRR